MVTRTPSVPAHAQARSALRCDIDLAAEGKHTGFVRLPHSVHRSAYGWLPIPIVSIRNGAGPAVLVVAGNHGDEWEGQIALGQLIRALTPEHVRGRLVVLPAANFPAAMAGTRISSIDDGNLNRTFPGDPDGGVTQQIAWWMEHILLPGFDFSFDLHSGGSSLSYLPCTLAYRSTDAQRMRATLDLVRAFGAPLSYIVMAPQSGGKSFTSASLRQGVLSIATEIGGGNFVTPGSMAIMCDGIRRVLTHVGLLHGGSAAPAPRTRLTEVGGDDYHVYASDPGLFEPLVDIGVEVSAGQPAARIHDAHTPWRAPVTLHFARAGLVLCKRIPVPCERGDCLFQLATDVDAAVLESS
jgi:predicted deacylase